MPPAELRSLCSGVKNIAAVSQPGREDPVLVRPTGRPANGPATPAEPAELGNAQDSARLPIPYFGEGLATDAAGYGQDGPCDSRIPAQRGPALQPTAYTADTDALLKLLAKLVLRILNQQQGDRYQQEASAPEAPGTALDLPDD